MLNNIEYTELILLYTQCGYIFTSKKKKKKNKQTNKFPECKGGKLPILQLPMAIRDTVLYMGEVGYTYLSSWITWIQIFPPY